jgi:hypothetical protein
VAQARKVAVEVEHTHQADLVVEVVVVEMVEVMMKTA